MDYMHLTFVMKREGLSANDIKKRYSSLRVEELIKFQETYKNVLEYLIPPIERSNIIVNLRVSMNLLIFAVKNKVIFKDIQVDTILETI